MTADVKCPERVVVRFSAGSHERNGSVVGPIKSARVPGFWAIRFDDGGTLAIHEDNLRPAGCVQ